MQTVSWPFISATASFITVGSNLKTRMPKTKNLKGLPGNLGLSYLSTLGYYNGGYTADWIDYVAREKSIKEIEVDILNKSVTPKEAEIKPLLVDLDKLNGIIDAELKSNGFDINFISKAILRFQIPIDSPHEKGTIYCFPVLEDINGKVYTPKKRIVERAYDIDFDFITRRTQKLAKTKLSIMDKIKSIFKK